MTHETMPKNTHHEEPQKALYVAYEQSYTITQYHFYLSAAIGDPTCYVDMIHTMQTAGPGDTIYLHLNNSGGQLNTGVQIINAMQNSQARVVTILESLAHSLATLIFLAGDEMVVHDHCMMMFHNFRGGFGGKGQEVAAEIEATITWFVTLAQDMYIPFLSQDEFNRIIRGEDLWMQSPEIRERLEHMFKVLGEQQTAAEAEQQEKVPTAKKIPTKKVPTAKKIPTKKVPSTKAKVAK